MRSLEARRVGAEPERLSARSSLELWPSRPTTAQPRRRRGRNEDRRRTAYHEGGHAIVGMLTSGADPVRKVSIIPRGMALGVTFFALDADRGRAAEEIVFGEISTGAESDLEQLTALARQMVGRWGMSDALGPISVIPRDGSGPFLPGASEVAPETRKLVDDEVRRIVAEAHDEVVTLLTENRARLDALASALLEMSFVPATFGASGQGHNVEPLRTTEVLRRARQQADLQALWGRRRISECGLGAREVLCGADPDNRTS